MCIVIIVENVIKAAIWLYYYQMLSNILISFNFKILY